MKCNSTGKVRHRSKRKALIAYEAINNVGLNAYFCHSCKGWHLGTSSNPWKQQARIDQLLGKGPEGKV